MGRGRLRHRHAIGQTIGAHHRARHGANGPAELNARKEAHHGGVLRAHYERARRPMTRRGQRTSRLVGSFLAVGAVGAIGILTGYALLLRPWLLRWGSTRAERALPVPGDDVVPTPTHVTTRAITIAAPTDAIWPWLVQMGQDRAGFYTHNWVERLLRSSIPEVHDLHPEWQELHVGDLMRTNRELQPGHPLGWTVARVEPRQALVLLSRTLPVGTYAFSLRPRASGGSRLLVRDRAVWRWWQAPFRLFLFEPLHAYMQTGQLQGIKQRAEQHVQSQVNANAKV